MGIFILYPYIQIELGNLGGVLLMALCVRMIVHPSKIP